MAESESACSKGGRPEGGRGGVLCQGVTNVQTVVHSGVWWPEFYPRIGNFRASSSTALPMSS